MQRPTTKKGRENGCELWTYILPNLLCALSVWWDIPVLPLHFVRGSHHVHSRCIQTFNCCGLFHPNSHRCALLLQWKLDIKRSDMATRFELATRSVTSPDSENFAPLELQDSLTWKILALPYQKYTFSERKFHEEFKYGIQYDIGSGTKILWLKIFGFWGPQNWIFARSISHSPFDPISNSIAYLNSSLNFLSGDI